jgi:excisionase family DNA binding protein
VGAAEAAAMLGISRSTFYVLLKSKRLPAPRIACGRLRRWSVADIARVAAEGLEDPPDVRRRKARA